MSRKESAKEKIERLEQELQARDQRISELEQLVYRDPLTNAWNFRMMEAALVREWARTNREKGALGLIVLDVNDLKVVNNTQGHGAGNLLLQKVSTIVGRIIRTEDIFCRTGGDEFMIILPNLQQKDIQKFCMRVKAALALGGVSAAVGAAVSTEATDTGGLVELADQRMYAQKSADKKAART